MTGSKGSEQRASRILVLEDEPAVATVLVDLLADEGHRVAVASTVAEAMAELDEEPAVAILDKNLPDGSGLDVLREAKRRWPFCEALMFTGYPSFESVVEALELGATDYLVKPLRNLAELRHRVRRCLERRSLLLAQQRTIAELREAQRLQALAAHSEMMAQLGRMLAGVVHELRSPLTYVSGNIELVRMRLMRSGGSEESVQSLGDALEGVSRIVALVADVRRVSATSGFSRESLQLVPVRELVDSAVNLTRGECLSRGRVEVVHDGDPRVHGSRVRLTQVLVNLLVNAAHACEGGGNVVVRSRALEDRVSIAVEDSGSGMSPEVQARIFEPFFTTKPEGVGTGLGLALARSIVEEHGGTMAVRSEVGTGSAFTIELPAARG